MATPAPIQVNPALDWDGIAARFAKDRVVAIPDFLTAESVEALAGAMAAETRWRQVMNSGSKVFDLDPGQLAALDSAQRQRLDTAVHEAARAGFQFRFQSIRVPDDAAERRRSGSALDGLADFLGSAAMLACWRRLPGLEEAGFADAQGTRYGSGDFLTAHNDDVPGKGRLAAYVLSLTAGWRPEWGGLLMFHDDEGGIRRVLAPRFNTLNLFAVPQSHSVSYVAPFADGWRMSVTGWLRTAASRGP